MPKATVVLVLFCTLFISGCTSFPKKAPTFSPNSEQSLTPTDTPSTSTETDFSAQFEIYTLGTKRIFTQAMYHHQSPDVFIESPDPSIVHIKKIGITWSNFFQTLPFSLNKECLITGTKQTFCSNDSQKLRFILNGVEQPEALDMIIQPQDVLIVRYE